MVMEKSTPLHADDWTRAALEAIADSGIGAVAIEPLARRVGASKGSFYWHFDDRAALVAAAVASWEETRTEAVVRAFEGVEDPRERLRRLFAGAFGDVRGGRLDAALIADAGDPAAGPAVRRVTERRIAFIATAFEELGFTRPEARHRALTAYGAHLGLLSIRACAPGTVPSTGKRLSAYIDDLLDLLTRR